MGSTSGRVLIKFQIEVQRNTRSLASPIPCSVSAVEQVFEYLWAPISDPFLELRISFSEERPFLRGPVSGSVLGSVLAFILDRKVFENKAEETREREGS